MLKKVWKFVQHPVYKEYKEAPLSYKKKTLVSLLVLGLAFGILSGLANAVITELFHIDIGKHASEKLFDMSTGIIFLLVAIVAPVVEEFIFRAPLGFFKDSPYFKDAFYVSILAFGLVHISNFEFSTTVLILTPLLIAPQLFLGVFLGYIRVRIGLIWSILLHSIYNTILFLPMLAAELLNIPIE